MAAIYLVLCCLSSLWYVGLTYVDITRATDGDIFTNQKNGSEVCSSYGGRCVNLCCKECQCIANKTTYVRHKRRCITSLTSILFRDNQGCSYRLVPNDFHDSKPRGSQACVFTDLSVPAVDQSISGSLLIDICGIFTWSIASCMVMSGAYYENGHWKDIWYAGSNQTTFAIEKRLGVTIHLKWNNTLSSRYYGYILSLDVRCTRKFGRTDVDSCLLFKVKGTQMDKRPSTPSPSNDTAGTATAVGSQGVPESSAVPVMIVTGGICGVFAVVLISLMTFCLWKRKGLNTMSMRKRKPRKQGTGAPSVDMTSSPLYDVNEYQCVNQQEAAIYTTPQKTGYQDLVFTRPTYQPLVVQTRETPSSIHHSLEEPGENNNTTDVNCHEYHVLEGP